MSFRSQANQPVVVNGSMAANIASTVSLIPKLSMNTYSYSWSGTSPVGTITVQVSNDYSINAEGAILNAGTWTTIPFTNLLGSVVTSFAIASNSGTGFIEAMTGAKAIQTLYTATSGTGTLNVVFNAKVT